MPFLVYWWAVWATTGVGTYLTLDGGLIDAVRIVDGFDGLAGTQLSGRLDPDLGNVAMAIALNEMLEPIRLPIVVRATQPPPPPPPPPPGLSGRMQVLTTPAVARLFGTRRR